MTARDFDRVQFVTRHFQSLQGLRHWVPLGLLLLSVGGHTYFDNRPYLLLRAVFFAAALGLAFAAPRYYRRAFGFVEPQPLLAAPPRATASLSVYAPAGLSLPSLDAAPRSLVRRWGLALGVALALNFFLRAVSPGVTVVADESLVQAPWSLEGVIVMVSSASEWMSLERASGGQYLYLVCGVVFLGTWLLRGLRISQSHHLVFGLGCTTLAVAGAALGGLVGKEGEVYALASRFVPFLTQVWVAALLCGGALVLCGLLDHAQLARGLGRFARGPREVGE
jgi:hypothetical protein